ncbi:MAG: ATP-binding cassette domain-containing protein [Promethearchaeota archaeon]
MTATAAHPLEMKQLSMSFDERIIFRDFSMALNHEETLGLTGPSGRGKSTILRIAINLIQPTSGEVLFQGENIQSYDPRELRRRMILVPQRASMFPRTVEENLLWGLKIHGIEATDEILIEVLDEVELEARFLSKVAQTLSGGEQQRVALARALLLEPEVLLLDEPTSALDEETQVAIEKTINTIISERSISVLIVTHDKLQASRFTSRILDISDFGG